LEGPECRIQLSRNGGKKKEQNKKNFAKPSRAKNLGGEGPQTDNHLPQKSVFKSNFF
jgi:hypothetical protein